MVGSGVIIGLIVSLIICFGLFIVPYMILHVKKQRAGRAFLFGILAFVVSQIVLRIPLLQLLSGTYWYQTMLQNPLQLGLFLGITAGIFEEGARFICCRWILKKNHRYVDALSFGFGHGGIEAILLAGLPIISSVILVFAINNGTIESMVGPQADAITKQLLQITPLLSLMGGLERVLAVCIHVGLSVMVFAGFARNKPWQYLGAAILLHALVDALVVIVPSYVNMSALALEAMVAVPSIGLLIWAIRAKRLFVLPEQPGQPAQQELIESEQNMEEEQPQ